ncbi:MAG TPA: hypothetical protein PKN80_06345 [bacterium]|uniref:Haloacid dehalogenase-like hydrolase n=1 Tax=candidate division TA06 bacterium ADurb.Bin417 TaxID=1852828 RepID=A0A1V5MCZ1_UNCT6|nr:MAG: haloacid dehalogenase-like hydrolase [candidate division TA06 bacterium ADurb.Bin417]HNQ35669.1 hypothetical protein [bacterium]HNS48566.1 hypothetical protein [bacterium]
MNQPDLAPLEILQELPPDRPALKFAVLDFDGTISTLRQGWEGIMRPLMLEMIAGPTPVDPDLEREVDEFIDHSTGIQTIFQMQWLAEAVKRHGRNPDYHDDPWWYKAEYNRRLMELVDRRIADIQSGRKAPSDYQIKGGLDFLAALQARRISIYFFSGTDHGDVRRESTLIGAAAFAALIVGAPEGRAECSKEAVLRQLIQERGFKGPEVLVVGDGRVEIALGREVGALTLGMATDEVRREGVNPRKRARLEKAGAHAIAGDFTCLPKLLAWLGLSS